MYHVHQKRMIIGLILFLFCIFPLVCQTTIAPGAQLVTVYSSNIYFEGPTWDPGTNKLYFSTPDNSPYTVYQCNTSNQTSVWMSTSERWNGTFLANDGRLIVAEQQNPKIASYRIGANGPEDKQILAQNSSWNPPNDLCQTPNGHIYFTAPSWSVPSQAVYHLTPQGVVSLIITDMSKPNGIIASPDGSKLYVGDYDTKNWRVYPINADGSIGSGSIFFNPSSGNMNGTDGMSIDEYGNLYLTGKGGLWIVSPEGNQLDYISIPEYASNVTFGGVDGMTLYITCQNKVYSLQTTVHGVDWATSNPTPTPGGMRGDVNNSGSVDIVDALLIAQFYVGLTPSNFNEALADTNCDGSVDIIDALLVAQYYVGLLTSFC